MSGQNPKLLPARGDVLLDIPLIIYKCELNKDEKVQNHLLYKSPLFVPEAADHYGGGGGVGWYSACIYELL